MSAIAVSVLRRIFGIRQAIIKWECNGRTTTCGWPLKYFAKRRGKSALKRKQGPARSADRARPRRIPARRSTVSISDEEEERTHANDGDVPAGRGARRRRHHHARGARSSCASRRNDRREVLDSEP